MKWKEKKPVNWFPITYTVCQIFFIDLPWATFTLIFKGIFSRWCGVFWLITTENTADLAKQLMKLISELVDLTSLLTLLTRIPQYSDEPCLAKRFRLIVTMLLPLPKDMQAGVLWSRAWTAPEYWLLKRTLIFIAPALHVAVTCGAKSASCPRACESSKKVD